jgi:hypothetical protein
VDLSSDIVIGLGNGAARSGVRAHDGVSPHVHAPSHLPRGGRRDGAGGGVAPELGWTLLCNGVLVVEAADGWSDDGEPEDPCGLSLADLADDGGSALPAAFGGWRWKVPGTPVAVGRPRSRSPTSSATMPDDRGGAAAQPRTVLTSR